MELKKLFLGLFGKGVDKKTANILTCLAIIGMVLILATSFFKGGEAEGAEATTLTMEQYAVAVEERLQNIIEKIDGVGIAHVMVTIESGVEYRYAADEKQSGDSVFTYADSQQAPLKVEEKEDRQQSYILVDSSSGKQPLVLTEFSPKIKGVVVVCNGANNPVVRSRITEAVQVIFGVSSLQVCVVEGAQ